MSVNKMNDTTLIEAPLVGLYALLMYYVSGRNLFITGFLKHFMGYYFGIHSLYCQRKMTNRDLLRDSIIEGLVFYVIHPNTPMNVVLTGSVLHIGAEVTGLHSRFCSGVIKK